MTPEHPLKASCQSGRLPAISAANAAWRNAWSLALPPSRIKTYAEAFVGMGGVFFRRRSRPRSEVINDRNGDVANLFRILQRHYPQFMDTLRFQITSRREFERLKASDPATLTDLERAGRFLYLQRLAFGGKVAGQNFGVDPRSSAGFNLTTLAPLPGGCSRAACRRRHRAARLVGLHRPLRPAGHAVLSRSALLRQRGRLWQGAVRPRPVRGARPQADRAN
jgi:hypothetical protein